MNKIFKMLRAKVLLKCVCCVDHKEREMVRERRECLVRYVAFIQQALGGHMTDEVCTTNDSETMGNYLQFKD